jgi:hypothetical protein
MQSRFTDAVGFAEMRNSSDGQGSNDPQILSRCISRAPGSYLG